MNGNFVFSTIFGVLVFSCFHVFMFSFFFSFFSLILSTAVRTAVVFVGFS